MKGCSLILSTMVAFLESPRTSDLEITDLKSFIVTAYCLLWFDSEFLHRLMVWMHAPQQVEMFWKVADPLCGTN